jgi:hypothetical protein
MISANALWLLALAPVVMIEGWFMARWKWERPYESAVGGNLLSMLAALPFGVILSLAGGYIYSEGGRAALSFLPDSIRFFLVQVLLYGDTPVPTYGFIFGFNSAGTFLAALIFIGLCWLLTFTVEGSYYSRRNPSRPRGEIFRGTALANLASYCFLIALWLPYSYFSASAAQDSEREFCAQPSAWSGRCNDIWAKFPAVRELRLASCVKGQIPKERCLERSNAMRSPINAR